ncbi:ABC transporter substrate-binding protein [Serinibacter arcticus]|uniref:Oligopeptide ABC transporter, periplasmic oligopeptide-binding protein OppA n=1 Tax=Serinibacter arcticus TaxID=1655435 RepID=A0A4Z1DWV9_9MICO|nr:ABC transporter substrate-binding protein [Serinibacter arcticus]TGO04135.1 Oligopeptide ABC transporter, periplasmic oligopeptide-binding protein OppA [Serinibacter arcticus]
MTAGFAAVAATALVLSACTSSPGGDDPTTGESSSDTADPSAEPTEAYEGTDKQDLGDVTTVDDQISYSLGEDEWLGYNGNTPETYSTYNSVVNDRIQSGFTYFGTDGTIYVNEDLGNVELVSEDPMVVEYTIADDAVWSDGTPITYDDALFSWATQAIADGQDADGADVPLFNYVGGLDLGSRTTAPVGEPGGKTFTLEYTNPYPDYMISTLMQFPLHVAAEQAGTTSEDVIAAIEAADVEALRPVAEFYNTGWLSPTPGTLPDEAIALSSGPYVLSSWEAGQSITLEANPEWWGTPPATSTLVYRFAAAETQVQALANGDLNIIEPQATVDTVSQIEAIGDSVTLLTGPSLTWEHLDFNFNNGPFATSLPLREAFAMCVPRQLIVDNLIAPIDPEAVVMNAREVFPFQDNYEDVVSQSYDGRYDEVDIAGAQAKIAESGVAGPIDVRIGYSAPNARRTEQVALIKDSCDQAGFNVTDVGNDAFFDQTLPNGDYEVALFAWAGSGQIASGLSIYSTGGGQNYGGYSNADVDAAWQALSSTLDPAEQQAEIVTIETNLWDDLYGIPVFAHPGVTAFDSTIQNVRDTATQSTVAWNAEQWVRAN